MRVAEQRARTQRAHRLGVPPEAIAADLAVELDQVRRWVDAEERRKAKIREHGDKTRRIPTCGHPDRKHYSNYRCESCDRSWRYRLRKAGIQRPRVVRKIAACHPERKHSALGLCAACYRAQAHQKRAERKRVERESEPSEKPSLERARKALIFGKSIEQIAIALTGSASPEDIEAAWAFVDAPCKRSA